MTVACSSHMARVLSLTQIAHRLPAWVVGSSALDGGRVYDGKPYCSGVLYSISGAVHRYGVNGGGNFPAVSGWRRRMQDWLIQKASTQQQMRTSPIGPT